MIDKNKQYIKEYLIIIRKIEHSQYFIINKEYKHHGGDNTIYKHCISVGYRAYKMCKALSMSKERTESVVKAALLHDIFGYSWTNNKDDIKNIWRKYKGINRIKMLHAFHHGIAAVENISKYECLNDNQKDAIIKHMFPLYPIPPRHIEGWILVIADKLVAIQEIINGIYFNIKCFERNRKNNNMIASYN